MVEYRKGARTVFEIHLHLVWLTKYRRPALHGEVATRVGLDPEYLRAARCVDHEVSCIEGPCASADLAATAGDDRPSDCRNCSRSSLVPTDAAPKLLLQMWELCQKMMRRAAFQPLH